MSIEVTYHGLRPFDKATPSDVLQAQVDGPIGNLFTVAGGQKSEPLQFTGLYRIYPVTNSRVRVGPSNLANGSTGARMSAGAVEVLWLQSGQVIACDDII